MATDKSGANPTIETSDGRYTIAVDGQHVGHAAVADRGNQRVFHHTEIDPRFGGRGLATTLVLAAFNATQADGKRIVPVCSMVAAVLEKHPEFKGIADPVTDEILEWARTLPR